ncbi:hypothetical protein HpDR146_11400 [Helicobacter pylori]
MGALSQVTPISIQDFKDMASAYKGCDIIGAEIQTNKGTYKFNFEKK